MSDIKRFTMRQRMVNGMTFCSARKLGSTMRYWYYVQINKKWRLFDVRTVEENTKGSADITGHIVGMNPAQFELMLCSDLHKVAKFVEAAYSQYGESIFTVQP